MKNQNAKLKIKYLNYANIFIYFTFSSYKQRKVLEVNTANVSCGHLYMMGLIMFFSIFFLVFSVLSRF